jgi:hypothetical protein
MSTFESNPIRGNCVHIWSDTVASVQLVGLSVVSYPLSGFSCELFLGINYMRVQ